MKNAILSLVRHGLTAVGAYLIGKGILSEGGATELVAAVITLLGAGWGAWDEYKAENKKPLAD